MLWSVGRFDLRLTDEEFWTMVPRQYYALMERFHQSKLRAEHGPALIATILARAHGSKRSKMSDFMPSWEASSKQGTTWQDQLAKVRALHVALGGA